MGTVIYYTCDNGMCLNREQGSKELNFGRTFAPPKWRTHQLGVVFGGPSVRHFCSDKCYGEWADKNGVEVSTLSILQAFKELTK